MNALGRGWTTAALATVVLAGCASAPRAPAEPTAAVSQQQVTPGERVDVTAAGFPDDRVVDIGFGPPDSEYEVIAQGLTDLRGRLNASVIVPQWARSGQHYVFVVAVRDTGIRAVTDRVLVRP